MSFEDLGLLFFTVLILSLLLTPASIRFARLIGAMDQPVNRSVHSAAMPRMGGIGMAVALLIGLLLFVPVDPVLLGFLAGLLIITITGMVDDVWRISPLIKMAGQLIACIIFIECSGIYLNSLGNLFAFGEITFSGPFAYAVTLFCLIGVINAFNMSDGLDGLAAGIAAIVCLFFVAFALDSHIEIALILAITIFASVLGFLKFNSYPARLFMGDTGSLMLGYSLGCLAVILGGNGFDSTIAPISIAIVVGLPLVDTLWVMTHRLMQGKSPLFPDQTHVHHRLLALGLSHAAVVSIVYGCMILLGIFALVVKDLAEYWQFAFVVMLITALYSFLILCERKLLNLSSFFANMRIEPMDLHHGIVRKLSRSAELFLYAIPVGLSIPLLIADAVPANIKELAFALAVFATLVFLLKKSTKDQINVIHGIFYVSSFFILYAWHVSYYEAFHLGGYATIFAGLLFVWAALEIKLAERSGVLLTSSFEILLIFISWFLPYAILPAIALPEHILNAAKLACLEAIPLFIAIKLVTRRQSDRNMMAAGLISILCLIGIRGF